MEEISLVERERDSGQLSRARETVDSGLDGGKIALELSVEGGCVWRVWWSFIPGQAQLVDGNQATASD